MSGRLPGFREITTTLIAEMNQKAPLTSYFAKVLPALEALIMSAANLRDLTVKKRKTILRSLKTIKELQA